MKMNKLLTGLVIVAFAFVPQESRCQTGNPRGIFKLMSIETRQAQVTDYLDQYKVCTDSVTLNIRVEAPMRMFGFSVNNKVYDYTGDMPASSDDKSDLIYDSDNQHFTLKWWVPNDPDLQAQNHVFVPNDWCIEKYKSGQYSSAGKIIFDALTQSELSDKTNPLLGTWRNLGSLFVLNEEKVDSLRKDYPNSVFYNKWFYVFTPTHGVLTKEVNNTITGTYFNVIYNGRESFKDDAAFQPYQLKWMSDDCVAAAFPLVDNNILYIVLERVKDGVPVLNRIAYWFVPRDFDWHLKQADAGNHVSQFQVGVAYISGNGIGQNMQKGLAYIMKSAEGGYAHAQYVIGLAYLHGEMVEQNKEKGFSLLLKAAEQKEPNAQSLVGACYIDGIGVQKDEIEGLKWLELSANAGNVGAQTMLGYYYQDPQKGNDAAKAFAFLMQAAQQGNAQAQNEVGVMYSRGDGVEKDYAAAVEWYQKSAEQGNPVAQSNLGFKYRNGQGVEKDIQKSFEWFMKAAEGGYAPAQNEVAWMLYTGEDVPQDLPRAVEWAKKAVEQGNSYGYGTLAEMYYKGKGVAKDKVKAFELYSKGAELNDSESMRMLAIMYKKGEATKKDKKKAAYWQQKYEEANSK